MLHFVVVITLPFQHEQMGCDRAEGGFCGVDVYRASSEVIGWKLGRVDLPRASFLIVVVRLVSLRAGEKVASLNQKSTGFEFFVELCQKEISMSAQHVFRDDVNAGS